MPFLLKELCNKIYLSIAVCTIFEIKDFSISSVAESQLSFLNKTKKKTCFVFFVCVFMLSKLNS